MILYKVFTLKICKVFRANMLYFNVDKKLMENYPKVTYYNCTISMTKKVTRKISNKKKNKMLKLITCYHTRILTLRCFCCLFKTSFSQLIWSSSIRFNLKDDKAWSMISKNFPLHTFLQVESPLRCCIM